MLQTKIMHGDDASSATASIALLQHVYISELLISPHDQEVTAQHGDLRRS